MSKTRKQLIEDITNARKKSKENLLYIKGLSKMKKDELKKIDEQLQELLTNDDDENMDLDEEREMLKQTLITIGDETDDLDELDYYENDTDDEQTKTEPEQPEQPEQPEPEQPEQPEPEQPKQPEQPEPEQPEPEPEQTNTLIEYEQEIKEMLNDLKYSINEELNEYRTLGNLRQGEINAIYEHYDKLVDTLQFNINEIKKELLEGQTISDTMYDDIDNTLSKVELRIKRFIEN
jgi:ABC-type transporter Mla subunit MlaD